MKNFLFYSGVGFQLFGMISVGACLISGLFKGDYAKLELYQFVGGTLIFYLGHFLRSRVSK